MMVLYIFIAIAGVVIVVWGFTLLFKKLGILVEPRVFTEEEKAYISKVRDELARMGKSIDLWERDHHPAPMRDEIIISEGFDRGLDFRAFIREQEEYIDQFFKDGGSRTRLP